MPCEQLPVQYFHRSSTIRDLDYAVQSRLAGLRVPSVFCSGGGAECILCIPFVPDSALVVIMTGDQA